MEDHFIRHDLQWERWSTNRAAQCDIYVRLFDNRVGSQGNLLFRHMFHSFVRTEEYQARGRAIVELTYKLERPFPDQHLLLRPGEEAAYERCLEMTDTQIDGFSNERYIEGYLRDGVPVTTVSELKVRLEADLRVPMHRVVGHRCKMWVRNYFNNNEAAWQRAYEDESLGIGTDRIAVLKRLRVIIFALGAIWITIVLKFLSINSPFLWSELLIGIVLFVVLAYRPTFIRVGTKTIIARHIFV